MLPLGQKHQQASGYYPTLAAAHQELTRSTIKRHWRIQRPRDTGEDTSQHSKYLYCHRQSAPARS